MKRGALIVVGLEHINPRVGLGLQRVDVALARGEKQLAENCVLRGIMAFGRVEFGLAETRKHLEVVEGKVLHQRGRHGDTASRIADLVETGRPDRDAANIGHDKKDAATDP